MNLEQFELFVHQNLPMLRSRQHIHEQLADQLFLLTQLALQSGTNLEELAELSHARHVDLINHKNMVANQQFFDTQRIEAELAKLDLDGDNLWEEQETVTTAEPDNTELG